MKRLEAIGEVTDFARLAATIRVLRDKDVTRHLRDATREVESIQNQIDSFLAQMHPALPDDTSTLRIPVPARETLQAYCDRAQDLQRRRSENSRQLDSEKRQSFLQNCRPDRFFAFSRLILLSRAWVSGPPRGMLCFHNNKIPRR